MLESGEIDALYTARAPDSFFSAPDKVGRLFADPMAAEIDYFQRSGIFPPMHLVCGEASAIARGEPLAAAGAATTPSRNRSASSRLRLHDSATLAIGHALAGAATGGDGARCWAPISGLPASPPTAHVFATLIRYMRDEGHAEARPGAGGSLPRFAPGNLIDGHHR
jgi:4,5-dihydroxyphthalate decarboxylase